MSTRRQFIQAGISASALVGAGSLLADAAHAAWSTTPSRPLDRVIYEDRFEAGRKFGAEAARLGYRVEPIQGDIHRLWYEDLYYRWKESKAPVAGMTDFRSLFLLEMMAVDAGLRVVYRGHHIPRASGVSHELFGPSAFRPGLTQRINIAGTDWSREAARLITTFPILSDPLSTRGSNVVSANSRVLDGHALVSWIITLPTERLS